MKKTITKFVQMIAIFMSTFLIVLVVNQMFYGNCYQGHCVASAFPKVFLISLLASAFVYWRLNKEQ